MLNFALANEKVERFSISGNKTFVPTTIYINPR